MYSRTLTADGSFSVKSCFLRFREKLSTPPLHDSLMKAANHLWKVKGPSKILHFGWRIILNRLATKDNLHKKGIEAIANKLFCVFCGDEVESLNHLLSSCGILSAIWSFVYIWM